MKEADGKIRAIVTDTLPEDARTIKADGAKRGKKSATGTGKKTKTSRIVAFVDENPVNDEPAGKGNGTKGAGETEKSARSSGGAQAGRKGPATGGKSTRKSTSKTARAKAKKPNEKISPASIYKKMLAFGKIYRVDTEQDFLEAARIYAEEAGLIDQMRDRLAEDGLTVMKTYKTGDVEVAHPLLSELPRHVESANKCLTTIGNMITERGERSEKPVRELDQFRLH